MVEVCSRDCRCCVLWQACSRWCLLVPLVPTQYNQGVTSADHSSENMTVRVSAWWMSLWRLSALLSWLLQAQVTRYLPKILYMYPTVEGCPSGFLPVTIIYAINVPSTGCAAVHTNARGCSDLLCPLIRATRISSSACLCLRKRNLYDLGDLWVLLGPKGRDVAFDTEKPFRIS